MDKSAFQLSVCEVHAGASYTPREREGKAAAWLRLDSCFLGDWMTMSIMPIARILFLGKVRPVKYHDTMDHSLCTPNTQTHFILMRFIMPFLSLFVLFPRSPNYSKNILKRRIVETICKCHSNSRNYSIRIRNFEYSHTSTYNVHHFQFNTDATKLQ